MSPSAFSSLSSSLFHADAAAHDAAGTNVVAAAAGTTNM
jgi:hypothetical protein